MDHPLVPFASRSELRRARMCPASPPRGGYPDGPPMGFDDPTTHTARSSDSRRDIHTRLRSAYRFSRPLDALLRFKPSRPCFMPVAPMGFRPSGGFPRAQVPWLVTPGLPSWRFSSAVRRMLINISSAEARRGCVMRTSGAFGRLQGLAPSSESVLPFRCYPEFVSRSPPGLPFASPGPLP